MTELERRLFAQSFVVGIICTLIVVTAHAVGLLTPLDNWLYDMRATYAQFHTPAPSSRIAHLDIDDASIDAIGKWPWPRATMARILDEVNMARPSAVGLDILFSEPSLTDFVQNADGTFSKTDDDARLSNALRRSGVAVLAASFDLEPAEHTWPMLDRAVGWFKVDLEMTPPRFAQKLGPEARKMDQPALDDLFLHARRLAMRARIDDELNARRTGLPQLMKLLLPRTDPDVASSLTNLLQTQYQVATADQAINRFGAPAVPMDPPPLQGTLSEIPLANFTNAVAGCGFVNFDIFGNATVRSIPLIVQYKDKFYPQFGLAVACVALGADPRNVRFDHAQVIIPTRTGPITIPTYTYHSRSVDKDVPLIAAIPWFGGQSWETMYDWPAHRDPSAHVSITKVWDLCLIHDVIQKNSSQIDKALAVLLDDERPDEFEVKPELWKRYASAKPDLLDTDSRAAMVKTALKALDDLGLLGQYDSTPDKDLSPVDRLLRDRLHDAVNALKAGVANNAQAKLLLDAQRQQLAKMLGDKAVFVGFTAAGLVDNVTTSLHLHCPGVVAHGVMANAVLTGRWWTVAPSWLVLILTLLLGITTAASQGRLPPMKGGFFALGLALVYWIVNWGLLFALDRYLVGMAGPMIVIAVVWAVCTLQRVVVEGVERIKVATENQIFQKEMLLAKNVQKALVPDKAPELPGINADGWTLPADMTGGDLFDLWQLPDGRLGILVADASGHGLAPAMIVSQVRTLVHMMSEYEPNPHDLLRRVNTQLARDLETGRFVTAFLAFLRTDGELQWASAGHGPMYWCPTGEGELLELDSSGLPLGVQEDWLADDPSPPLKMELTGRLIVFSDGIFEAHALDPKVGLFGTDPIKEILHNACHASSTEIIHSIRDAVQKFQGKKEPVDDQTIVVVRRVAPEGTPAPGKDQPIHQTPSPTPETISLESPGFQIAVDTGTNST
jgi:CHASE2 domain-containing sensor protein